MSAAAREYLQTSAETTKTEQTVPRSADYKQIPGCRCTAVASPTIFAPRRRRSRKRRDLETKGRYVCRSRSELPTTTQLLKCSTDYQPVFHLLAMPRKESYR